MLSALSAAFRDSRFKIQYSRFKIQDSRFKIQDIKIQDVTIQDSQGAPFLAQIPFHHSSFFPLPLLPSASMPLSPLQEAPKHRVRVRVRVHGSWFRVRVKSSSRSTSEFKIQHSRFKIQDTRFKIQDLSER